uniref:threonine-phosphate decarboxylase CobD n=2 Tax=Bacillus sp. OTU530 TaxID=3043862 RepID=UPI00313C3869
MAWIEAHGHGGDMLTAASVFGLEDRAFLDFSANINPLGPPPRVMELLRDQLSAIVHYPDPSQRLLKEKLAEKLHISSEHLVIGNGAAECMAVILLALQPKKVGIVNPCFSEYAQLATAFGAQVVSCEGRWERHYQPHLPDLFQLLSEADLVFIGHPNNPTGVVYTKEELTQIAEQAAKTNTYLVVDEAFLDFLPRSEQVTLLPNLNMHRHVILVRSMTKFYAIPGLRLGYAIAHPELIGQMKGKQVTWSVNQLALVAGEACLEEHGYEEKTIGLVRKQREYLKQQLEELGLFVFPGQANFLLVRLQNGRTAADVQWDMGRRGILIRSCAMYPGLTVDDFRIAVRTKEENDQLLHVLKEIL